MHHTLGATYSLPKLVRTRDIHMGWLRLVGSLQLQVSFAKEHYERDYILQKRPKILRSFLIQATPYIYMHTHTYTNTYIHIHVMYNSLNRYIYMYLLYMNPYAYKSHALEAAVQQAQRNLVAVKTA